MKRRTLKSRIARYFNKRFGSRSVQPLTTDAAPDLRSETPDMEPYVWSDADSETSIDPDVVDFLCNVCGTQNIAAPRILVQNREAASCGHCRSSLRMRSVIYALSTSLWGEALPIGSFPTRKEVRGLGMSDWDGYADRLSDAVDYTNTYYHTEPRLDITDVPDAWIGLQDFLISSDVFEHIPLNALQSAFQNSYKLLKDGGVFVLTVPFTKSGTTVEHFPDLHAYEFNEVDGAFVLNNTTISGESQTFHDLIFHGGPGSTLEMRIFSEPDLVRYLSEAGFTDIRVCADVVPEFGLLWPIDWAVPIVARR